MISGEAYDVNFCLPVPEALESERVRLTPFIPSKHADTFFSSSTSALYEHIPFGPFETVEQFLSVLVEGRLRPDPGCVLFAVYDKTRPSVATAGVDERLGELAGVIGLVSTSTMNLSTEIGPVLTLPSFQRTHVTSNAIGLMLRYTLDPPSQGGLGLRRVVWQASVNNLPSIKAAERLGFKQEGVARWAFVLPEGKRIGNGLERRKEDPERNKLGRDSAVLSICWDEWEDGGRTLVDTIIARKL